MKKGNAPRKSPSASPSWKTKWPRNGDLASWYRCGIEKCKAITDIELASDEAHCPINALAELGHTKEALKHVNAFLKRLPRTEKYSVEILRMAELGALICLMDSNLVGCEKYLAIALECDDLVTRKCDLNWASKYVREFRVNQGLLNPVEANDDERLDATFYFNARMLQNALKENDRTNSKKMLDCMLQCIQDRKIKALKKSQWISQASHWHVPLEAKRR